MHRATQQLEEVLKFSSFSLPAFISYTILQRYVTTVLVLNKKKKGDNYRQFATAECIVRC